MPGVQTSLRAISAGTAQLPPIAPEPPEHLIGANTVAALNNGAMFALPPNWTDWLTAWRQNWASR